MDNHLLARGIRRKAADLGFDRVGFCDAGPTAQTGHFERWLDEGHHASMSWLEKGRRKRLDPRLVLEGARSMVVVALRYAQPSAGLDPPAGGEGTGTMARYALGDDYHDVMGRRLEVIVRLIEESAPGHRALWYVDTGPILERLWAARAGIGWVGKNALVLNKDMGSYFLLGVVVTTAPLPPDEPAMDQCGSCALCIEACPTVAIIEPRVVDSGRCLSYHTIELRGSVPVEFRPALGNRVFGCDDCQDACPWNRQQDASRETPAAFPPREGSTAPPLLELLRLSHEDYLDRFRGSAVKRATYRGLRRNAAIALANGAGSPEEAVRALDDAASSPDEDPLVAEHAAWALDRLRRR